jgi:hypothetical protein
LPGAAPGLFGRVTAQRQHRDDSLKLDEKIGNFEKRDDLPASMARLRTIGCGPLFRHNEQSCAFNQTVPKSFLNSAFHCANLNIRIPDRAVAVINGK